MFLLKKPKITPYRKERKYFIPGGTRKGLSNLVRQLPGSFSISYPDRWVNSLYFDDAAFSGVLDNFRGIGNRRKYRLRWYGDWSSEDTTLHFEIKERANQASRKQLFPDIVQDKMIWFDSKGQALLQNQQFYPRLGIKYKRSYFQSFDRKIRLTLDYEMACCFPDKHDAVGWWPMPGLVLEVKYPVGEEERAIPIMQELPFRPDRHSKYIRAIEILYAVD